MNEERLVNIETKIAFQEHTIKELNEVICEQQNQIDKLTATCKILLNRIQDISEMFPGSTAGDEKPPHY